MKTDFIFDRSTIAPKQMPNRLNSELGGLSKEPNQKRISRRTTKGRHKKQRTCIFCLLLLILLLVSALYVAALFLIRTCTCEITTKLNKGATSSLDVKTTPSLVPVRNTSVEMSTTFTKDREIQRTLEPTSAPTLTTGMSIEINQKFHSSVEAHMTSGQISAQNTTIGSRGREFIVLFTTPPLKSNALERKKNIYVTSENGTKLNITTSPRLDVSLKSQIDRTVHIPSSQRIILPQAIELQSFQKEVKSVLIKTSSDVFIISHDDDKDSVGSTTHIPIYKLSTKYIVISTKPASKSYSQLAVAAIEDNTSISVTFKMKHNLPLKIEGKKFYNGDVFNFSLDRFETYQIEHKADLTGTFIESSAPIAAFSGNDCNELENIGACDHLVEQLPPTNSIDKTYIVPPNSDDRDTLIRITATENTHFSYMIGGDTQTLFLERLDYFDTHISSSQSCFIESKVPLLVTSIGLGSRNSVTAMGDPSMTIVPGINQYLDYYKIVVPPGYDHNYVSIMINLAFKDLLRINDKTINKRDIVFEENVLASSVTYSVRTVRVVEGELTASTVNGERFGLMFAGVTEYEAYGFSGNSLLL